MSIELDKDHQEVMLICRHFLQNLDSYETTMALDFGYRYQEIEQHTLTLLK